jgi:DNA-directed RNA polymerase-3 subunit RPC5
MAIESTATNSNPKVVAAAVAAAMGANAPLPELAAAVGKIASNIENVYFLSSLGNPSLDPFRNVVIALLRAKGPNAGLRRSDIMEASKIALRSEVPGATYQKVLKELCYTRGGAWVLKPGDGRPT